MSKKRTIYIYWVVRKRCVCSQTSCRMLRLKFSCTVLRNYFPHKNCITTVAHTAKVLTTGCILKTKDLRERKSSPKNRRDFLNININFFLRETVNYYAFFLFSHTQRRFYRVASRFEYPTTLLLLT
jgi:hypothetical protein